MNPIYGIEINWTGFGLFHLLALGGAVLFLLEAVWARRSGRGKGLSPKTPEEGA